VAVLKSCSSSAVLPGVETVVEGFSFVVADVLLIVSDVDIVDGVAVAFPSTETA